MPGSVYKYAPLCWPRLQQESDSAVGAMGMNRLAMRAY